MSDPAGSETGGAWTPEEMELLAKGGTDPVDVDAALAWMRGEGPDPWRERSR